MTEVEKDFIFETFLALLGGVPTTLALVGVSLFLGFILSLPLAVWRFSKSRLLRGASFVYSQTVRSVPLLVIIFLIYYGAGQFRSFLESVGLWVFFREPWFCAILALTIEESAYTSEILRGGIKSVPHTQIEAARAHGMRSLMLFRRIIFPVAFRNALPAYGNEIILLIKGTALVSTITIMEITGTAQQIIAQTYKPIPVFVMAGAIYLGINFIAMQAIRFLERRLSPDLYGRKIMGSAVRSAGSVQAS